MKLTSKKHPLVLVGCSLLIITGIMLIASAFIIDLNQPITTQTVSTLPDQLNQLPKAYVIQSGSMEPTIKTASLVIALPQASYSIGDIITFSQGKTTTTHRLGNITGTPPYLDYHTFGDANEDYDANSIAKDNIIGKVVLTLPYLGYPIEFAKTPHGFIALIIIPATIIIYEELKNILKEFKKQASKFVSKRSTTPPANNPSTKLTKGMLILPLIASATFLVGITTSYFFDIETVAVNTITIATPTPTPVLFNLNSAPHTSPPATPSATPTKTATSSATATNSAQLNP